MIVMASAAKVKMFGGLSNSAAYQIRLHIRDLRLEICTYKLTFEKRETFLRPQTLFLSDASMLSDIGNTGRAMDFV
jgi:hypothetical protein